MDSSTKLSSKCVRNLWPPICSFSPSLWGDTFTSFAFDDEVQEKYARDIEQLNKQVRNMLMATSPKLMITLVDTLERLGLAHHFVEEMQHKLDEIYEFHTSEGDCILLTIALAFRLLRQHQYRISSAVFDKFVDKDKNFNEVLINDVEGLLSLYEAAHIRIHGEDILDKAVVFTTRHLSRVVTQLVSPLKDKVKRGLEQSLHRGAPIIEIRHYISIYEIDESRDDLLLKLAKLNFNFMQILYKKELNEISRWWNNFDLKKKLPYTRDRLIECYLWGTAFHFEPKYSYVWKAAAISMQMVSILDDTYDNYGTLDEVQLLTDALERWDINDIDQLPEFMKIVYKFVMSIYDDFVVQLGRAYYREQTWTMGGVHYQFCDHKLRLCYVHSTTSWHWLLSEPKIVISTAKTGRYYDDLGSQERENKDGKMLTVVDCYMKHHGLSKEETLSKFIELVEDGWKNINKEWATGTSVPKDLVEQLVNYVRIPEVTYKNWEDGYTYTEKALAPQIAAVFIDPIPI